MQKKSVGANMKQYELKTNEKPIGKQVFELSQMPNTIKGLEISYAMIYSSCGLRKISGSWLGNAD